MGWFIATVEQSMVEEEDKASAFCFICTEGVYTCDIAKYEAVKDARWMGRVWYDVVI